MVKFTTEEAEKEKLEKLERVAKFTIEAGRHFFVRECLREGIDPERGVSPSLLKALGAK